MLIIRSWLEEWIDLKDLDHDTLAHTLTHLGFEVEATRLIPAFDPRIVVGQVLTVSPHPNADKLRLAEVQVDTTTTLSIVCGAANLAPEMKVAVALMGAQLPGGTTIKATTIRGVPSAGMILAADELALTPIPQAGIMPLPASHHVGAALETQSPGAEVIFDLAITPNRGDCLSYIGIARDLGAKLTRPYHPPQLPPQAPQLAPPAWLQTRARAKLCVRYMALLVTGVPGDAPAPLMIQRRLHLSGMRPKNLMVDLTNYLMLEWGQPAHAFDAALLPRRADRRADLDVQHAPSGAQFTTIGGTTLHLDATDMVVTSADQPVALAGVMGGAATEVSASSHEYVIEFADFNPQAVARTASRHRLHSEAAYRFERAIHGAAMTTVTTRFSQLLSEHYPTAQIHEPVEAFAPEHGNLARTYPTPHLALRVERARAYLGLPELTVAKCIDILDALECALVDQKSTRLVVAIPTHRHDLTREVDLIEEVARILGYDTIPATFPTVDPRRLQAREHPAIALTSSIKSSLAQLGLNEILVYPMISAHDEQACRLTEPHPMCADFRVRNALSDHNLLPTTLVSSMLKALTFNHSRQSHHVQMFQLARGFVHTTSPNHDPHHPLSWWRRPPHAGSYHSTTATEPPHHATTEEIPLLGLLIDAPTKERSWQPGGMAGFYAIKQLLEALWSCLGLGNTVHYQSLKDHAEDALIPFIHPAASALLQVDQLTFGYCGTLHPQVAHEWGLDLNQPPIIAEIHVDTLTHLALHHPKPPVTPAAKYPPCLRDLAVVLPKDMAAEAAEAAIMSHPQRRHLAAAELFDIFTGSPLDPTQKSLAFHLRFSSTTTTLKDRDVDTELTSLCEYLATTHGIKRRDAADAPPE